MRQGRKSSQSGKTVLTENTRQIPLNLIDEPAYRIRRGYMEDRLILLSRSIRNGGLLQPVIVRKINDRYELVVGYRRLVATRRLGLKAIPAREMDLDDADAILVALTENLHREGIDPNEEARAFRLLRKRYGKSLREIGDAIGHGKSYVSERIKLLELPRSLIAEVEVGAIKPSTAEEVLKLPSKEDQEAVGYRIVHKRLDYDEAKKYIVAYMTERKRRPKAKPEKLAHKAERRRRHVKQCDWCLELMLSDEIEQRLICRRCLTRLVRWRR